MINSLHTNKSREHIISTQQTSGVSLSLREEIVSALRAAMNKASQLPTDANTNRVENLFEQLTILDAIDFGFICPVLGQEGAA